MHRIPLSEVPAQLLPLVSLIRQWVSSQGFSHAMPTDCAALMVKTLVQKTHSVLATSAKFKLPSKICLLFVYSLLFSGSCFLYLPRVYNCYLWESHFVNQLLHTEKRTPLQGFCIQKAKQL